MAQRILMTQSTGAKSVEADAAAFKHAKAHDSPMDSTQLPPNVLMQTLQVLSNNWKAPQPTVDVPSPYGTTGLPTCTCTLCLAVVLSVSLGVRLSMCVCVCIFFFDARERLPHNKALSERRRVAKLNVWDIGSQTCSKLRTTLCSWMPTRKSRRLKKDRSQNVSSQLCKVRVCVVYAAAMARTGLREKKCTNNDRNYAKTEIIHVRYKQ